MEDSEKCSVCYEFAEEKVITSCNHLFCKKCLSQWGLISQTCPMCRTAIVIEQPPIVQPSIQEVMDILGDLDFVLTGTGNDDDGYNLTVILDGQPNWVPDEWWEEGQRQGLQYMAMLSVMNRGAYGFIHLTSSLTVLDEDRIWICDHCRNPYYISTDFEEVDVHEREQHPDLYDPELAEYNRGLIQGAGLDVPY